MDTDALVSEQILAGQRLVDELIDQRIDLVAACWMKPSEEERWELYLFTPLIDREGEIAAYGEINRVFRSLGWIDLKSDDIRLRSDTHPIASGVRNLLNRRGGILPVRAKRPTLGGSWPAEVYAYPVLNRRPPLELSEEEERSLVDVYNSHPLAIDELPYSNEMQLIYQAFVAHTGSALTIRDVFKALKNLSRQGRLGGKIRAKAALEAGNGSAPATEVPVLGDA